MYGVSGPLPPACHSWPAECISTGPPSLLACYDPRCCLMAAGSLSRSVCLSVTPVVHA